MSGNRLLPWFGNSGGGTGGGYSRFNNEGAEYNANKRMMSGSLRDMYNWPGAFAPPPPPPARVNCGELRRMDTGKVVEMAGRVHKISRDRFIQLKDSYGVTQLVVPSERADLQRRFQRMPLMSFVVVLGEVHARPISGQNEKMTTGQIEVIVEDILMVRVQKPENKTRMPTLREPSTEENPPKVTSEEYHKFHGLLPQLNNRKYTCGDLPFKVNETVTLLCWVEKSSKKFVTLMDGYGKIQCVVPSNRDEIIAVADHLSATSVVVVTGKVTDRPKTQINYTSVNGHIELQIESLEWPTFDMEKIGQAAIEMKCEEDETSVMSRHTGRTHTCGELRATHAGRSVALAGWLQFNRLNKFLIIHDAYGTTQCVITDPESPLTKLEIPLESVIKIEGVVAMRPPSMINEDIPTGEIEVIIKQLLVLSPANKAPYIPKPNETQDEVTRLQYRMPLPPPALPHPAPHATPADALLRRLSTAAAGVARGAEGGSAGGGNGILEKNGYIDLRSRGMQNNLRLRSQMLQNMRNFLTDKHQFIEVETPTLTTNYLTETDALKVITGQEGLEYSLVQSPQLHTQYLMVGQMDRCFQLSKTYTRWPVQGQSELTLLHVSMSFTDQDNFLYFIEQLLHDTFPKCVAPPPFTRLPHCDALRTYGSHQPDISYDLKFYNVTSLMENSDKLEKFGAYVVIYPKSIGKFSHGMRSLLTALKSKYKNAQVVLNSTRELSTLREQAVNNMIHLDQNNSFIVAFGDNDEACRSLGEVRQQLAEELASKGLLNKAKTGVKPVWVTEPPMFMRAVDGTPQAGPHSCSALHPDDMTVLPTQPLEARAIGFTLVMNGESFGTGSVRNTEVTLLQRQIELTKMDEAVASNFLVAVQSGCPPYATISLDIDKLAALACGADSIRDVIAFPKSESGHELIFTEVAPKRKLDIDSIEPSNKMQRLH